MFAVSNCQPGWNSFKDWTYCLWFIVSVVVAPMLFCVVSIFFGFVTIYPLYHLAGRLAGAPFQVGDHVRILVGPHRGKVVEVSEVRGELSEIRVELGKEAWEANKDIFRYTKVCREHGDRRSAQVPKSAQS